jgi:hypothetical protein
MIRFGWIFLTILTVGHADTLILRNGNSITGDWLGSDAQQVRFLVKDQVRTFPRGGVAQVDFDGPGAPAAAKPAPASSPRAARTSGERCALSHLKHRSSCQSPRPSGRIGTLRLCADR